MYNLLYFVRIRNGYTQQALAERAGISRRTVCSLEQTGRVPSMRVLLKLCEALQCSPEEVLR